MAFNKNGGAEIAISVFGGLVTETAPVDLPEGVSPDCQDVIFAPGSVAGRQCLSKVFATPFPQGSAVTTSTVTYAKTFLNPDPIGGGSYLNLYLDSNGNLWVENLFLPGTYNFLSAVTPQTYAKSVTAFGREYIAINDGLHGADIPLQYDGTNLDRVTQDGPGAAPTVTSLALPQANMAVISGSGPTIVSITTTDQVSYGGLGLYYTTATLIFTGASGLNLGSPITVSGNSNSTFNTYLGGVIAIVNSTTVKVIYYSTAFLTGTGGTVAGTGAATMQRASNIVTVATATAHQLQVGYQALIAGVPAASIGTSVSSIVINNENLPGVATVTTSTAHGLIPGLFVTINGISQVAVGSGMSSATWSASVATIVTSAPHGLVPGAIVTLAGASVAAYDTTQGVLQVISPTSFTIPMVVLTAPAASTGGTVSLNWPVPDTATPSYYEVIAAPTPTTFQVDLNYCDSTFTSGTVSYAWDGTFYVSAVLSSTSFQYQQYGPDASTNSVGTVTPYGQAAPGQHQCQVLFLTRNGYITRPGPPVTFTANGGQYVSVTNMPIGPANVVARILAFTGAYGATFFYIPVPAQINGQVVSTSTQIADNITTAVVLDFSDNTLFAGLGLSIPGNTPANQQVIDGALGFGYYANRLGTWGQRNTIQNLLNMHFDGGYLAGTSLPLGWTYGGSGGTLVTTGRWGGAWQMLVNGAPITGQLSQSMYQDAYGNPIAQPNTYYTMRGWFRLSAAATDVVFVATIGSASTGFVSAAILAVPNSTTGQWAQLQFGLPMPNVIPSDLKLSIGGSSTSSLVALTADELSIVYAENAYTETVMNFSYVQNPEAFDGLTGVVGSAEDTAKAMDMGQIRETLYWLTRDPGGRLHETSDNGVTEPAGWTTAQVSTNCGVVSAFGVTKSQGDSATASGGEQWLSWISASGARIFGGSQAWKISQEIEPDFSGALIAGASQWSAQGGINYSYCLTAWALNDPITRQMYFGLPTDAPYNTTQGAPNVIYVMNYRELDTAEQIASSAPIRTSYTGRLIATDHTRKWTRWNMTMNGAALMKRTPMGRLLPVFFAGNRYTLGLSPGLSNVYTLSASKLTDDDYGLVSPYYVTYFLPSHDQEGQLTYEQMTAQGVQRMQLGGGRKLLAYVEAFISGVGQVTITPLCGALGFPWALTGVRTLVTNPNFDLEWAGGMAQGSRIALQWASSPVTGTDNTFNLQKIVATFKRAQRLPVRGSAA